MMKSIGNFIKMLSIKKELNSNEIDEMHDLIKRHGFNEGFEIFERGQVIKRNRDEQEKQSLIYKYSNNEFEVKKEKKDRKKGITIDGFIPTIESIKQLDRLFTYSNSGYHCAVYEKVNGLFYAIVEGNNIEPIIMTHEKGLQAYNLASTKVKEFAESTAKSQTRHQEDIDISHVERAMGLDNNRLNSKDNNIDDTLKDLF